MAVEDRANWSMVAVAGLLAFIAMLDMSVVNVALVDISRELDIDQETAQWAVLGYQLPVVALLLPAGMWLNGAPGRSVLLVSVAGFAACGLLAAAASGPVWLIGARIAQGVFGAALFVLMPVVAARSAPPALRGRAMSVPATLGPLGAVIGPAAGGPLVDAFGWQAVFLVKIPVCLAAFLLTLRHGDPAGRWTTPDLSSVRGAALSASGVGLVLLGLTFATGSPTWAAFCIAGLVALVVWSRGAGRPVRAVVHESGTGGVHAAVLVLALAFATMNYLVGLRLQEVDRLSATATGTTLLAFAAGMGLAGPVGGRLADLFGAHRIAPAGAALTAVGMASLLTLGPQWTQGEVAWRLLVAGVGMGLYGGPAQLLVMTSVPAEKAATAGATVQLARSLGFTLGPACATAAWTAGGPSAGLWLATVAACGAVPLLFPRGRNPLSV
ncbi:MFS transporter [Lentzea sp. HUAS12]|uniref:MFS transporter n=1 Tax=Lentzea sp. HUAS12 TaxID=2951806 RepID=UPI00209EE2C6|nr:MFS transporter [Lentzea sp. HUAS12]USX54021.1 MFS transporter [Lentzea sp. HUAS12]